MADRRLCCANVDTLKGNAGVRAVNHQAAARVLYTELVNNKPTQEQTGAQSNQCRFNVYWPLCVCVRARVGKLDHRINPQGKRG